MEKLTKITQEPGSDNTEWNLRKLFESHNKMIDIINELQEQIEKKEDFANVIRSV